jgi:hypothetical protein
MDPSLRWGDGNEGELLSTLAVMPAQAGIHAEIAPGTAAAWTPAFAGVTGEGLAGPDSPRARRLATTPFMRRDILNPLFSIPARHAIIALR